MTVCITGDVHHTSLGTRDQKYMDRTELEAAVEYAGIAGEYDVPVTLFVTGRAAAEEPERLRRLVAMEHVEVGGHNYWAFDTPVHKGWRALAKVTGERIGSWSGPRLFQSWEIGRTVEALAGVGAEVTSWRDHAYRHDRHTASLLADHGITRLSDRVEPGGKVDASGPLLDVPINTPPDHEHVYHSFRTPEFVADAPFSGPFGEQSHSVDAWIKIVQSEIGRVRGNGGVATVLAHPSCMDLADGMGSFRRLVADVAASHETVRMRDIGPHVDSA